MSSTFRLIFRGEIMPGYQIDAVKQRASTLFKVPPERVDALFSGQEIVIRKGVSDADLHRYMAALQKAGLRIHAEPENDLPPLFASAEEPESAFKPRPVSTSQSTQKNTVQQQQPMFLEEEQVTCPKCGHIQPKRTLCLNCSIDMPAYSRGQQRIEEEPIHERDPDFRYDFQGTPTVSQPPALFGFGFSGRWGRLTWLSAGLFKGIVALLLFLATWSFIFIPDLLISPTYSFDKSGSGTAIAGLALLLLWLPLGLLFFFWQFRDAALRCHDLGWSGFWSLLLLVPIISFLFTIGLLFLPGQQDANEYDAPPTQESWLVVIFGLILIIALSIFTIKKIEKTVLAAATTHQTQLNQGGYNSQQTGTNQVIMYSLTTCGYCDQKRAQLKQEGIQFTEYFLDKDQRQTELLWQKLRQTGYRGGVGTPTFEVNGVLLPNNPSMAVIKSHLK